MSDEYSKVLTEVRFWAQILGDAKRTVICEPDLESRVKGWVDARGMGHLIKVVVSPVCPTGQVLVIDEQALAADLDRPIRIEFGW